NNAVITENSPPALPIGKTVEVVLGSEGFTPHNVTISAGDVIRFRTEQNGPFWPASDLHPTHGIYPEFDPLSPIEPDNSWTFQFLKSGRWKYHDHLAPMYKGEIVVN